MSPATTVICLICHKKIFGTDSTYCGLIGDVSDWIGQTDLDTQRDVFYSHVVLRVLEYSSSSLPTDYMSPATTVICLICLICHKKILGLIALIVGCLEMFQIALVRQIWAIRDGFYYDSHVAYHISNAMQYSNTAL